MIRTAHAFGNALTGGEFRSNVITGKTQKCHHNGINVDNS